MKFDLVHGLIFIALIAGVTTIIVLGHGQTLIQVVGAVAIASPAIVAIFVRSPMDAKKAEEEKKE